MPGPKTLIAANSKVRDLGDILIAANGKVRRVERILMASNGKVRLVYQKASGGGDIGDLTWTSDPFLDSAAGAGDWCGSVQVYPDTDGFRPNQVGIQLIDSTNWVSFLPAGVDSSDYEVRVQNFSDDQGNTLAGPSGWVTVDAPLQWDVSPSCTNLDGGLVIITYEIAFRKIGGDPNGITKQITQTYT